MQQDIFTQELDLKIRPHENYRVSDCETSREAAEAGARTGVIARQAKWVLDALKYYGKSTCKELAVMSGLDYHLVARRMADLNKKDLVRRTGEKRQGAMEWEVNNG